MTVTYNKFDAFALDVLVGKHDFASDVFRLLLTNTAPVAGDTVKGDLVEISEGNGYPPGGPALTITEAAVSGVAQVSAPEVLIAASGGPIGPFRYACFYNDTSPTKPLISWWDYGAEVTLFNTETITVRFNPVTGIFRMS